MSKVVKSVGKSIKKGFNSTIGRVVVGTLTGGLSEVARAGLKSVKPKVAAIPGIPTAKSATGELEKAGKGARKDRRRGRASTILTGRQGIKNPNPLGGSGKLG